MTEEQFLSYYRAAREAVKRQEAQKALSHVQGLLLGLSNTLKQPRPMPYLIKTAKLMQQFRRVADDLQTKGITEDVLSFFALKATVKTSPAVQSQSQGWCADIFANNRKSVVEICADSGDGFASLGTGVIISAKGYLLTNDHIVFDESRDLYHTTIGFSFAGDDNGYPCKLVCSDQSVDLALCRFSPKAVGTFSGVRRISDYNALQPGADVVLIGNFFGMGLSPINGIVRKTRNSSGEMEHSALSNEGDSGGPLFNRSGDCVGINRAKTAVINGHTVDGIRNAIPMDTVEKLLSQWSKKYGIEF